MSCCSWRQPMKRGSFRSTAVRIFRRWLNAGLLEDGVELLELLVGEFGVVDSIVVSLMNQVKALLMGCKPLANALNGPWLLCPGRLPQQFGRLFRTAFRYQ